MTQFDIAIVGGGGAGLTAAIYAARARRTTAVFEQMGAGGQIATTDLVENYPGFPGGINGFDLAQAMLHQAEKFGTKLVYEKVESLQPEADGLFDLSACGTGYRARAVIVTAGAEHRKLGIPGEAEFTGRGVSYCATCDAAFFPDQDVLVAGGGDAALDEGLYLTRYARTVTIVHRRGELRASALLQERARANPRIKFLLNHVIESIEGDGQVERARLRDLVAGSTREVPIGGVFIFVGQLPNSNLLKGLTPLDEGGHALVDLGMRTAVPGLFAAGDVRSGSVRQLVAACGDGATAAIEAEHFLAGRDAATG